jgi:Protein of unknown function (DUF1018)
MAVSFSSVAARHLRTASGKSDARKKLIMAVRAASRRLGIEDEDRKAIQLEVTGKASMSDMDAGDIGKVLDRLNRDRTGDGLGGISASYNPQRAHISKVKALWWTLYWLGEVAEPNDGALDTFVRRQTGLSSIRFLDHRAAPSVIEALKDMARKAGVKWPLHSDCKLLVRSNPKITLAHLDRHAVLGAIWGRLRERRLVLGITYFDYVSKAAGTTTMSLSLNHWMWTAPELDAGIRILGKKLRAAMAKQARIEANDR